MLKELSCENYFEALAKVKDLRSSSRKHQKESKLISNLQKLVKDCSGSESLFPQEQTYQVLGETKSTVNLASNRITIPYSTVMQTANSTIELGTIT